MSQEKAESVSQESESFENFSEEERNIHYGLLIVKGPGAMAPWLSEFGACLVTIYGIRRKDGRVEFGIGNENLPILKWVEANNFYNEWPE